ncbi:pyocin knob domain-containing protein [Pedobacter sp. PF22-3]|uniref:pyocin knob domain-containing protein n=1 Tax=Pedobacter sp. PF22-3 TaxID=2994467 RepID=UPI0022467FF7|nr:pyocin knob domain-containing protein [Pedobacter sp. PF22-3]MCX2495309.1 pyocin knob domain-containing protein [Pedobacter sp. PF22-3]
MLNKKVLLLITALGLSEAVIAQEPLTTANGVKTNANQYTGDLNINQNWGGTGMPGMYIFNAQTQINAPTSSDWYHIIEMQHDHGNNWIGQIGLGYFTDGLYYRQQYQSTWGNWHTVATQDWVQSQLNNPSKVRALGNGANLNDGNNYNTNSSLIVEAQTGGRLEDKGSSLEFVIPGNTDGSNPWGQARIMTVAGNTGNGNATGKMILGTRRMFDKYGNGQQWFYGDDIVIDGVGNIGMGTLSPREKLSVNGNIRAREIKVEATNWPDYVFAEGYKVGKLEELESYIKTHKHLPGMPSAQEVEANGITVSEMLKLQQQKIEELTLHLIEKDRQLRDEKVINIKQQQQLDRVINELLIIKKNIKH